MKAFFEDYILLNTKSYENIGLDMYPNIAMMAIALISVLFFVYLHIKRRTVFAFVSALMRREATSEEGALILNSLRMGGSRLLPFFLLHDSELRRLVIRVGQPTYTYEEYRELVKTKKLKKESVDPASSLFYLNPAEDQRAKYVFENYDTSVLKTVMISLLAVTIAAMLVVVSPELFSLINSLLASAG